MQTLIHYQKPFLISRPCVVTAVWVALLAWPCFLLHGQEPKEIKVQYDPEKLLQFKPNPEPRRPHVSPDGKMTIEVIFKQIRVLSLPEKELLHEFATPNKAMASTFSPDLKAIAFADCTGNLACGAVIYTRNLETGKQSEIGRCLGVVTRLTSSGDGKRLAAMSFYGPIGAMMAKQRFKLNIGGEVAVFDVSTQTDLLHMAYQLPGPPPRKIPEDFMPYWRTHIALDQDGATLLVAAPSGVIKVIDVETGNISISTDFDASIKAFEWSRTIQSARAGMNMRLGLDT